MNRLDPDLKRLIRWAHPAPEPRPDEAPFGFSTRAVAQWRAVQSLPAPAELKGFLAVAAGLSVTVILCGLLFLASQTRAPKPATDLTSAAQFFANRIAP